MLNYEDILCKILDNKNIKSILAKNKIDKDAMYKLSDDNNEYISYMLCYQNIDDDYIEKYKTKFNQNDWNYLINKSKLTNIIKYFKYFSKDNFIRIFFHKKNKEYFSYWFKNYFDVSVLGSILKVMKFTTEELKEIDYNFDARCWQSITWQNLDYQYIIDNIDNFSNFDDFIERKVFPIEYVIDHPKIFFNKKYFNRTIIKYKFDFEYLKQYINPDMQLTNLLIFQNVPIEYIKENISLFNGNDIISYKVLDENMIRYIFDNGLYNNDKTNCLNNILSRQKVSEQFLLDYKDDINWELALRNQMISDEFLDKLVNELKIDISKYKLSFMQKHCKLSEDFIAKHKDNLDERFILKYQKLSEQFIKDNNDFFNDRSVYDRKEFQELSEDFIKELKIKCKILN